VPPWNAESDVGNQRAQAAAAPILIRLCRSPNPDRRMSPGRARQPKLAMPMLAATNTRSRLAPRRRESAPPATAISARTHVPMTGHFMRPVPCPEPSAKPPAQQILDNLEWIARSGASALDFRGCAFLNAIAELGGESSEARDLAMTYKADGTASCCRGLKSTIPTRSRHSCHCLSTAPTRRSWRETILRRCARRLPPRAPCSKRRESALPPTARAGARRNPRGPHPNASGAQPFRSLRVSDDGLDNQALKPRDGLR
jgi:hypothetical protein